MISFREDGSIVIDFPDGPVTVNPPKWGTYVALRRARERLSDEYETKVAGLPDIPVPDEDDDSDDAKAQRKEIAPLLKERMRQAQDWAGDTLAQIWRLILLGDPTDPKLPGLATPRPSDDVDDWPPGILVDAADSFAGLRTTPTLLDQVWRQWGKARSAPGPTETPTA